LSFESRCRKSHQPHVRRRQRLLAPLALLVLCLALGPGTTAVAALQTTDPNPANSSGAAAAPASPDGADPSISQTLISPDGPIIPGRTAEWRLTFTNNGPSFAQSIVVTDRLEGQTFLSGANVRCSTADDIVTCTYPELAVGATWDIYLDTRVRPDLPLVDELTRTPPRSVVAGGSAEWVVVVKNNGPAGAQCAIHRYLRSEPHRWPGHPARN
jgi:hypothetical protein